MVRNLIDIVEDVKDGNRPDYEELRYALLVYVSMFNIEHRQLREVLMREGAQPKNSFDMYKSALNKSPKEWLGWANDPENPDYQKLRKAGNKVIDKVAGAKGGGDSG